jgi:integrase
MKPFKHASGKWAVQFPAKYGQDGKREMRYYKTRDDALEGIKDVTTERIEHGKSGVTARQREWINFAEKQLGDLSLLPEVIRHWKRTGERLNQIGAPEAVAEFLESAERDYQNRRTLNDIRERLNKFKKAFSSRSLHEITPTDIEKWLEGYSKGWDRWSYHKRLGPFFKLAKRRRWISQNPMEEVPKPETPTPERQIYTVEQFEKLLHNSEYPSKYEAIFPYVILCGFCFLRTAELVKMYASEQVLTWDHVLMDKGLIYVPKGVAKSTRRESGDERYIPLSDAAKHWLSEVRPVMKTGECVPHSAKKFGELWRGLIKKAGVRSIDNGLRHSAISYSLAANPEHGVALTAQWAGNSEKTIRKHYRRLIEPEQGKAWFNLEPSLGWASEPEPAPEVQEARLSS